VNAKVTDIAALAAEGLTMAEIGRRVDLSTSTVCYHARRLGIEAELKYSRRYDWPAVQRYYDAGHSITECQRQFGMARKTFSDAALRGAIVTRPQAVPMRDLLVAGRRRNRSHVKARLLKSGLKEGRCDDCGIAEWRGRPLPMELHHVNGDGTDNRLTNLRLLCPNCHSQTGNWGGRAKAMRARRPQ
jgi:5-methylcytosine-specific restriction endonuclease McrA